MTPPLLITEGFGAKQRLIIEGFGETIISPEIAALGYIDVDNLVGNYLVNVGIVVAEAMNDLPIKKVYTGTSVMIDTMPCLAITASSVDLERKTLGKTGVRVDVNLVGELWYFHEELTSHTRKNNTMRNAWEICEVLQQNTSINGWLHMQRSGVRNCAWTVRKHPDTAIAAARIVQDVTKRKIYDVS